MPQAKLENPIAQHRRKAVARAAVAVITLSDTRTADNDQSGDLIQKMLEGRGHTVPVRKIITDNRAVLRATLRELVRLKEINTIVTSGGTGIAASDITIETVRRLLDKEMPGFSALFMLLSYPESGSACLLSRATAGTIKDKLVFCLPGSPRACKLALESLILPELPHMLTMMGGR